MDDIIAVPLGTDFEVDLDAMALDLVTRQTVGVIGAPLTFFFSATPSGARIDPALSVALTDLGSGRYYGVLSGSAISAKLADYVGQRIYPRLTYAGDVFDGVFAGAEYRVTEVAEVTT